MHIADEVDFPGCQVEPAEDSKSGRGLRVADGKVIPNKGEVQLQFGVDGLQGQVHAITSTSQVANVPKPYRSVSMICDAGFDVLSATAEASARVTGSCHLVCTCPPVESYAASG